ncbi:MAG: O-antigen ligase family protein [Caldilineaceae bacterium]|nr:O-antigen ligase family protein [Caldilineaceae bacterium]
MFNALTSITRARRSPRLSSENRFGGNRFWGEISARTWQRCVIIAGVLLLSVVVAGNISLPLAAVTIALPVGIAVVLNFLFKPYLGPLALVVTGLLANIGTSNNFNPTVLLLVFLAALWLFDLIVHKQLLEAYQTRPVRPLLYLMGVTFLAFVIGQLHWFSVPPAPLDAQLAGVAVFVLSGSAFLMVAVYIRELRWLQWMVWLLVIIGSIYLLGRVPRPIRAVMSFFPWGSTSCLFFLWFTAHVFSQLLLNRSLGTVRLALLAVVLGASLYAVLVQTYDWKSGWIPVLVVMAAIVGLRWPRLLVFMGIAGLLMSPFLISKLISGDQYSYSTRVDAWRIMFDIIKVNPIIGLGPSNYYGYSALYSIRGYSVSFNSHNQYIDLVAQTGILGLACYLWFFWEVGKLGWRLRHRVPEGFAQAYLYGSLGGLCAMLVAGVLGDWVLPFVYNVGLVGMRSSLLGWLFLGGIISLERLYGDQTIRSDQAGEAISEYDADLIAGGRQLEAAIPQN